MDQAPIDVRYSELLSWLEERYLTPKDWAKRLEAINLKKNEVLDEFFNKETPEMKKLQDTFKLFRNNYDSFTYNDLMRFNQMILKTDEAKNKNFFGSYQSTIIKNSQLLISIYSKNNMHLCESSKFIIQNIGYEIPNFEKTSQYLDRTITDYQLKITEKNSQKEKNNEKIKNIFKTYNIRETTDPNEIALGLVGRLSALEGLLKEIEGKIKTEKISKIINAYRKFYKKIYEKEIEEVDSNILNNLKKINLEGDFSVSGATNPKKYDVIKQKIEEYKQKYENLSSFQADLEADMWNFKLVEQEKEKNNLNTALLDTNIRKKIINDLKELLIFVKHRIYQLNNKDEITLSMYHTELRDLNLELTIDFLNESKNYFIEILKLFDSKEFNFLLDIYEDEKNIKKILNSIELLKMDNSKAETQIKDLISKIEEMRKEIGENEKKIQQFKKDAKLIKKQMEKFLTDNLKRKITIIGDINLLN